MNSTSRTFLTLAAAVFFTALASVPAGADIYRGCMGIFSVTVVDGTGNVVPNTGKQLDIFDGRGACKNKAQANTCRSRAKDNVFRCANDLWAVRWNLIGDPNDGNPDGGLPDSCLGRATGAKNVGLFHKNPFGQVFDIKHAIEHAGCCELQPNADSLQMRLSVTSAGDKGCGSHKSGATYSESRLLEGNYQVDCERARAAGLCN